MIKVSDLFYSFAVVFAIGGAVLQYGLFLVAALLFLLVTVGLDRWFPDKDEVKYGPDETDR